MKKLAELVKVIENNPVCVVLEVKKKSELDLIKLGWFMGDETMFRVTKTSAIGFNTHVITVWRKDEKPAKWSYGAETTMVSEDVRRKGELIRECIEQDFHIRLGN